MRTIRVALALLALAVFGGCGRYYWSRPGGSQEEFNRDSAACAKEASPQYSIIIHDAYRGCLRTRGWVRTQQIDPAPPGWFRGIE